jgi:hypothetical protein
VAVGLRRLHVAEIHDLLGALNEHGPQRPGDGTTAVTGFFRPLPRWQIDWSEDPGWSCTEAQRLRWRNYRERDRKVSSVTS